MSDSENEERQVLYLPVAENKATKEIFSKLFSCLVSGVYNIDTLFLHICQLDQSKLMNCILECKLFHLFEIEESL